MVYNVLPQYDGTTPKTWRIGVTPNTTASLQSSLGLGVGDGWAVSFNPFRLEPGFYRLTNFTGVVRDTTAAFCSAVSFAIWWVDSTTYSDRVINDVFNKVVDIDISAGFLEVGAAASVVCTSSLGDELFEIVAGRTYYYGYIFDTTGDANRPYYSRMDDPNLPQGNCPQDTYAVGITGGASPTTITFDPTNPPPAGFKWRPYDAWTKALHPLGTMAGYFEFETAARKVMSVNTAAFTLNGSTTPFLIPVCIDDPYYLLAHESVVAGGNTLSIEISDCEAAGYEQSIKNTFVQDMGAADQMTFDGTNVALNGVAEAGNKFDLAILLDEVADKTNLFYTNTNNGQGAVGIAAPDARDIMTIAHGAADSGWGTEYAWADSAHYIKLVGTGTIVSIDVCRQPVIVMGDSQAASAGAVLNLLGEALVGKFTYPRSFIAAGIPGCAVATHTNTATSSRMHQRVRGLLPTQGAISEMRNVLFVLCGVGINDISLADNVEARRAPLVSGVLFGCSKMVSYMLGYLTNEGGAVTDANNGNQILIIGLPPWTAGLGVEQSAVVQVNECLKELAIQTRCVFYNPYDLVNADPTAYLADGLHYIDGGAGTDEIAQNAIDKYEAGTTESRESGSAGFIMGVL